jgi:hypothetical protein
MYNQATFADAVTLRVFGSYIDRAAPHHATSTLRGAFYLYNSDPTTVVNAKFDETGTVQFYNGQPFQILNYANGASATGHSEFAILSSDTVPELRWSFSGASKFRIQPNLTECSVVFDHSAGGTNPYVWINGARLAITAGNVSGNPAVDITQTWNSAGTTFSGFRYNVTDSASQTASLLLDLQIASATKFSVRKDGLITHASATLMATSVALTNGAAAQTGTLTNAPAAGNPTKWIPINDNGTTRYIPAW